MFLFFGLITILTQLFFLFIVENLLVMDNRLTGFLPSELGDLRKLQNMHFGSNQLEGTVPTQISLLSDLISLGLDHNYFSGTLPSLQKYDKMGKCDVYPHGSWLALYNVSTNHHLLFFF